MGLNAVLKDKGRTISQEKSEVRIEGTKQRITSQSVQFKCRLEMVKSSEASDQGYHRTAVRPRIMVGKRTELRANQSIEILSPQIHGNDEWVEYSIDGDPEPYRKKKSVVGWEANLVRVA